MRACVCVCVPLCVWGGVEVHVYAFACACMRVCACFYLSIMNPFTLLCAGEFDAERIFREFFGFNFDMGQGSLLLACTHQKMLLVFTVVDWHIDLW